MIGWISDLAEADSYLSTRTEAESWNADLLGSPLTGTLSTIGESNSVIGSGTLFQTELEIGEYLKYGYSFHKVTAIANNTELTLGSPLSLASARVRKFNSLEKDTQEARYTKKTRCLQTAYEEILYCNTLSLPETFTAAENDRLKKAQMLLGADRFIQSRNQRLANQRAGVKSMSIGNLSESYAEGLEEFSPWVGSFLFPFLKRNKNTRLIRQGMEMKPDLAYQGSDFYNPNA